MENYGYFALLIYAILNIIEKYDHNRKLEEHFPQDDSPKNREMFTDYSGHYYVDIFFIAVSVFGIVKGLVG